MSDDETKKLIQDISNVCKRILSRTLELMNSLQDEDSEYIDDVLDGIDGEEEPRSKILEALQNVSVSFIGDAETVDNEIVHFKPKKDEAFVDDKCPYLSQVWNGDIYDKTEDDGLRALVEDLNEQLLKVTSENLIQTVLDR
jgi:hypothetical protein